MLTYTQIGKFGRLGNQLFQYAALVGMANKVGVEVKLTPLGSLGSWHSQNCLLENFSISCGILDEPIHESIREPMNIDYYCPSVLERISSNPEKNYDLLGYFQTMRYFYGADEQIKKELTPQKHYIDEAKEYIESIRTNNQQVVSIHLRRGDNTDGTNPNYGQYNDSDIFDTSTIYGSYLSTAMEKFSDKNCKFLVFTGGSRTGDDSKDIAWANNSFKSDNIMVSDSNDPMKDFSRIMCCDHNIVSHMSSFGWWAAYLNINKETVTVAPKNYHLDNHRRGGFSPKKWSVI